ncbi:hypothetical protein QZM79_23355 [Burkholderia multivorans]|nr:hypothetical protein [Burkholderia multivorans]
MSGAADDRKVTSIVVSPYAAASRPGARAYVCARLRSPCRTRVIAARFSSTGRSSGENARNTRSGSVHTIRADGAKPVSILYHDVMYSRLRALVETFSYKRRNSGYDG